MNHSSILRIFVLLGIAICLLPIAAGAQFVQGFCAGQSGTALLGGATAQPGVIGTPILGTSNTGSGLVIGYAYLIILTVLMAMGILYMIASVANLPRLINTIKSEIVEIIGTVIIISIFFGTFFAGSAILGGKSQVVFAGPSNSIFVNDCVSLTETSLSLIPPMLGLSLMSTVINTISGLTIHIEPEGFGVQFQPLIGYSLLSKSINELTSATSLIIVGLLSIIFLLGLIYSVFPIFLYLGIVLRAFPWTRAAGGIFIAIFIGFYIIFPLMLNATLNNFSGIVVTETSNVITNSANTVGLLTNTAPSGVPTSVTSSFSGSNSGTGFLSSGLTLFESLYNNVLSCSTAASDYQCYGLINGYIHYFLEPTVFTILSVVISLIVSFDFTDMLSDILGAPSLSSQSLLSKVI